eukprot:jgi/Undpi1/5352/HiC_scaffold_2.g00633.m1
MGGQAQGPFDTMHFLKGGLAGGICCGVTHGALCPVDVVKTRIQLDPVQYNRGMIGAFGQVVKAEGVGALATGLGPTVVGYFIQGFFKFGGVELFKVKATEALGTRKAWENRLPIYLAAAATAEFVADVFLCPLEATRIRLVSDPTYANGLVSAVPKILKTEGVVRGFYSGFMPILFKQIPYTMAKFAVQGYAAEKIYAAVGSKPSEMGEAAKMGVSLSSGVIAGVAAAVISHPADTLLSMVNKEGAGGTGSVGTRLKNLFFEAGFKKLFLNGLGPRCVMIGTLTAGQFAIYDSVMTLTGASKFNFVNPDAVAA